MLNIMVFSGKLDIFQGPSGPSFFCYRIFPESVFKISRVDYNII